MRKKLTLVLLILVLALSTCVIFVACDDDTEPGPVTPPVEIKREDCDLVFGEGGISYKGTLAPVDSDSAIGGIVIATVPMTASGADLNVVSSIIKLNITLSDGTVEVIENSDAIAKVLILDFSTGLVTSNGKILTKDEPLDCTFKFTMPATDDMKYVGATFAITVRVTVTHANGEAV